MTKFLKLPKETYFVAILAQSEFFLKTAVIPQHLNVKDTESSRILFHHYHHAKIIQSICSIHQIICEIYLV